MNGSMNLPTVMLTVQQAADLIDVTPRTIQLLVEKGYLPRESRGQYPLVGVVRGYIRYLLFEKLSHETTGVIAAIRRDKIEIEIEIERRVEARVKELVREAPRRG